MVKLELRMAAPVYLDEIWRDKIYLSIPCWKSPPEDALTEVTHRGVHHSYDHRSITMLRRRPICLPLMVGS